LLAANASAHRALPYAKTTLRRILSTRNR